MWSWKLVVRIMGIDFQAFLDGKLYIYCFLINIIKTKRLHNVFRQVILVQASEFEVFLSESGRHISLRMFLVQVTNTILPMTIYFSQGA